MSNNRYPDWKTIAPAIAAELGDGWTARPNEHGTGATLTDSTPDAPLKLYLSQSANESRGTVRIDLPHDYLRHGESRPSIGVSFDRGPAAIARDIRRRLFTAENLQTASDVADRIKAHAEYKAGQDAALAAAESLPGYSSTDRGRDEVRGRFSRGPYYTAAVSGAGERADLELNGLTMDELRAALEAVAALRGM